MHNGLSLYRKRQISMVYVLVSYIRDSPSSEMGAHMKVEQSTTMVYEDYVS